MLVIHPILFIFCLETLGDSSCPINFWVEPSLASLFAISLPHTLACPGTQYSSPVCWVEYALITLVMKSCGSSSLFYSIGVSYQCKSTSLNAIQVKSWQTIVSMEEKLDVISRLELSEWIVDIWHNVRLTHNGIANRFIESDKSGPKVFV